MAPFWSHDVNIYRQYDGVFDFWPIWPTIIHKIIATSAADTPQAKLKQLDRGKVKSQGIYPWDLSMGIRLKT